MSIPRDSRVKIVGKNKEDKINAAHAYGGENGNRHRRRVFKSSC